MNKRNFKLNESHVGKYLTCKKDCVMIDSGKQETTAGKKYKIIKIENEKKFVIKNNSGKNHSFSTTMPYFDVTQLCRKEKLKDL